MNRTKTAPAMSAADVSAHAAGSYVRPFLSPVGAAALARLEADTSGWFPTAADHPSQEDEAVRRVRESGRALRAGLAEYYEWAEVAA